MSASAGIFSFLAKAGKLGKAPDIDLPTTKLELPDNFKDYSVVSISQDAGGNWLVKQPDGTFVRLDTVGSNPVDGDKVVLTLKADDLPHSLDQFDSLPADRPIFIRGKKGYLFELQREPSPALVYKNVRLPVASSDEIHEALWLLQRPSAVKGVRFVQLSERADKVLPEKVYGSRLAVESVGQSGLLASMRSMKRQTLVLSGRIEEGQLFGGGKGSGGILLGDLRRSAADNDIKLLILESDHPAAVLKKSARSMDHALKNSSALYDNIGDLFSRLSDSKNNQPLDLQVSPSGQNQMAIQWQPQKADRRIEGGEDGLVLFDHLHVHVLLHSVRLYTPDEARGRELDSRIIPGLPT
ncbi:MAG: hypothetical protein OQL20_08065, partial [Sedimenticola sp.]|nr:hypothetical protein [Sedimenticola sp.]